MDDFSDDDFDDLNETVFQELENNAIQFTQAQKLAQSQAAPPAQHDSFGYDFEDDDLDNTVVIDEHAQPPPRHPQQQQALPVQQPRHGPGVVGTQRWNQHLPQSKSSYPPRLQYQPPSHSVRQSLPSQRYPPAAPSQRYAPAAGSQRYQPAPSARPQHPPQQSQFARPPVPVSRQYVAQPSQARPASGPANQNDILATLQARLAELESDLTAAKGEASILRSKYDKARTTHEAEVARIKKENAERIAKQERIAEQARIAERHTATELQFARQDLREELGRSKPKRKDGPSTPRKDRKWGLGIPDGFDGVEILSSPSKGQTLRRKDSGPAAPGPSERTPTRGKRKRPAVDSPTFALETEGGDLPEKVQSSSTALAASLALAPRGSSLDYLRLFLDHTSIHGQPPTFDVFSRYTFPADPKHSLASIIFERLPQMGAPGEPVSLLVEFADMLIELWHQCLSEKYYGPIYHLVGLVLYTLDLNAVDVAPHIIPSLIPVCATTCKLVALPRLNSPDGDLSEHPDPGVRQLCVNIDVTHCLSAVYLAAMGCLPQPPQELEESDPPQLPPQAEFWRTMEFDFVLTMLSPKSPEADWLTMMLLLRTSVTADSIGPIPSAATDSPGGRPEMQTTEGVAAMLLDCISSFLCDPPRWAVSDTGRNIKARLSALTTLMTFATSSFGALHMAESRDVIPRLVTGLCWAIDRLYDSELPLSTGKGVVPAGMPPEKANDLMDVDDLDSNLTVGRQPDGADSKVPAVGEHPPNPRQDPMALCCQMISQAVSLLHFLVTDPRTSGVANITAKLAASHGGAQRYFLTLARLNFAEEDLVLEAGIDAETVDLAHELLELAVTPDEGEEISEIFD